MNKRAAPDQQQQGGGDRSLDFFWVIALCVCGAWIIWYFCKIYIAMGIFVVKSYEINIVNFFLIKISNILNFFKIGISINPYLRELHSVSITIAKNYGANVEFNLIKNVSNVVGKYTKIPIVIILFLLGIVLYSGGIIRKFRNIYSMKKLRKKEQVIWPQITLVAKTDLLEEPLDKFPWAVAQNPMKFCKMNNLILEETKNNKKIAILKHDMAHKLLSLQLGQRWEGRPYRLPNYLQILFTVFICCINDDKENADILLDKVAPNVHLNGRIMFHSAKLKLLMYKYMNKKSVIKICSMHAYVITMMASLLDAARSAGVISTAEFLWLKLVDRKMWYMLNSVGRYTSVPEISGAFAHWLAEKKLGIPLCIPMIEEAVNGLSTALSEMIYKSEED